MKRYFKISKYGRGFKHDYFALVPAGKKVRPGAWTRQLDKWGESTQGGHNYGWQIYANPCKRPKVLHRHLVLRFDPWNLEKANKRGR